MRHSLSDLRSTWNQSQRKTKDATTACFPHGQVAPLASNEEDTNSQLDRRVTDAEVDVPVLFYCNTRLLLGLTLSEIWEAIAKTNWFGELFRTSWVHQHQ